MQSNHQVPIIVVSGLPRSGTSMMMRMLIEGGVDGLVDGIRKADESNPGGYLEFEPVKRLAAGGTTDWLREARGRAVKVVSSLLRFLPETYEYRIIFMRRPLSEVVRSQDRMMTALGHSLGHTDPQQLLEELEGHIQHIGRLLAARRCFRSLDVEYAAALRDPRAAAERIAAFLDRPLDIDRMASVADERLYRNRA